MIKAAAPIMIFSTCNPGSHVTLKAWTVKPPWLPPVGQLNRSKLPILKTANLRYVMPRLNQSTNWNENFCVHWHPRKKLFFVLFSSHASYWVNSCVLFCYYIGNPISALCWKVPKQTMKLMLENLILSEILSGIKEQKDDICILRSNIISLASRRCNHCLWNF